MTVLLPESIDAWGSPDFGNVLKHELERLGAGQLPLQQGLSASSVALDDRLEVMFISAADASECIRARVGVFFAGIVAGCSCADDPTPVEPQNEYCEMLVIIDKTTASASITLSADDPDRD